MNTGLGWEADSAYLVNAANTYLGYSNERYFYKTYGGIAVGAFQYSADGWRGPVLISTEPLAVEYYYGSIYLGVEATFQYLRRTWYLNANHPYKTENWGTPLPVVYHPYITWGEVGIRVLEAAGVKPHVSWRGVSFAAGLAVGLATRAWAYLGEVVMGLITKMITRNGTYNAAADGADGYSSVVVNVPNSYTAADEGKVVSGGALAAQAAMTVTATGTYNTTDNNSVTVNIPAASGEVF